MEVVCADARAWVGEAAARGATFDLILQDGGTESYLPMLPDLIALLSDRGILVTDDVLFPVMDLPERVRPWQEAVAAYNRALARRRDLRTVWLPVGDGLAISVKNAAAPGSVFPDQERGEYAGGGLGSRDRGSSHGSDKSSRRPAAVTAPDEHGRSRRRSRKQDCRSAPVDAGPGIKRRK